MHHVSRRWRFHYAQNDRRGQPGGHQQIRVRQGLPLDVKQKEVYAYSVLPIIKSVLNGFNGAVFAYGQTSSGKTYDFLGIEDGSAWPFGTTKARVCNTTAPVQSICLVVIPLVVWLSYGSLLARVKGR